MSLKGSCEGANGGLALHGVWEGRVESGNGAGGGSWWEAMEGKGSVVGTVCMKIEGVSVKRRKGGVVRGSRTCFNLEFLNRQKHLGR